MKKALHFVITILVFASTAKAQIGKSSILLGGNIGFGRLKYEDTDAGKQTNFNLSPTVGIAVKENLVAGVEASYSKSKISNFNGSQMETQNVSGGFFARRYFSLGRSVYVYGQGNLSYGHGSNEQTNVDATKTETQTNGASIGITPGLAFAVSRRFHLELGFYSLAEFSYIRYKDTHTYLGGQSVSKRSSIGLNTGVSTATPLNIGFRLFLSE